MLTHLMISATYRSGPICLIAKDPKWMESLVARGLLINARSIVNKILERSTVALHFSLNFLGITETWLNDCIVDSELQTLCSGYSLFRKDQLNKKGSGLLLSW